MATKTETVNQVLELLDVVSIGQSPQHQDKTRVDTAYDEVYQDLKENGLATWASTGSVPTKLVPHVVALVAFNVIDIYGISDERYRRIAIRAANAKREIRLLTTPAYQSLEKPDSF